MSCSPRSSKPSLLVVFFFLLSTPRVVCDIASSSRQPAPLMEVRDSGWWALLWGTRSRGGRERDLSERDAMHDTQTDNDAMCRWGRSYM